MESPARTSASESVPRPETTSALWPHSVNVPSARCGSMTLTLILSMPLSAAGNLTIAFQRPAPLFPANDLNRISAPDEPADSSFSPVASGSASFATGFPPPAIAAASDATSPPIPSVAAPAPIPPERIPTAPCAWNMAAISPSMPWGRASLDPSRSSSVEPPASCASRFEATSEWASRHASGRACVRHGSSDSEDGTISSAAPDAASATFGFSFRERRETRLGPFMYLVDIGRMESQ